MMMQHGSDLMTRLTSSAVMDEAMAQIYKRRQNDFHNSDIWSFHSNWMQHAKAVLKDQRLLNLLYQYLNRVEVRHGDHHLIELGIPKGCPPYRH